jgi:hypothetical protein
MSNWFCHGGGLNEQVSICKDNNFRKLKHINTLLEKLDKVDNSKHGILPLKFIVTDMETMKSAAWLKENMTEIKATLAAIPDPFINSSFTPHVIEVIRELCVCLVELDVIYMCETTLEPLHKEDPDGSDFAYRNPLYLKWRPERPSADSMAAFVSYGRRCQDVRRDSTGSP